MKVISLSAMRKTALPITLSALLIGSSAYGADTEHYGPFFKTLPKSEWAFTAAIAADMLTTYDIRHHKALDETNAILGPHPSGTTIAAYGLSCAVLHSLITYELVSQNVPAPIVNAWEYITIGVEVGYVVHNYSLGLRIRSLWMGCFAQGCCYGRTTFECLKEVTR